MKAGEFVSSPLEREHNGGLLRMWPCGADSLRLSSNSIHGPYQNSWICWARFSRTQAIQRLSLEFSNFLLAVRRHPFNARVRAV